MLGEVGTPAGSAGSTSSGVRASWADPGAAGDADSGPDAGPDADPNLAYVPPGEAAVTPRSSLTQLLKQACILNPRPY